MASPFRFDWVGAFDPPRRAPFGGDQPPRKQESPWERRKRAEHERQERQEERRARRREKRREKETERKRERRKTETSIEANKLLDEIIEALRLLMPHTMRGITQDNLLFQDLKRLNEFEARLYEFRSRLPSSAEGLKARLKETVVVLNFAYREAYRLRELDPYPYDERETSSSVEPRTQRTLAKYLEDYLVLPPWLRARLHVAQPEDSAGRVEGVPPDSPPAPGDEEPHP